MKNLLIILILSCSRLAAGQDPDFKFHGLKVYVDDINQAEKFYGDFLGFELKENMESLVVSDQSFRIYIQKSQRRLETNYPASARTSLALQVDKLLPAIDLLRAHKLKVYDTLLERNGVGIAIPFQDYSGNVMHFIEVQVFDPGPIDKIRTYNCGVTISDMDKTSKFYLEILGFKEWSRSYLPAALPLKHEDGSFAFMIHAKKDLKANQTNHSASPQMNLILSTSDLVSAKRYLIESEVIIIDSRDKSSILCRDPEGNIIEIIEGE